MTVRPLPWKTTQFVLVFRYSERRGGPEHRGAWGKLDVGFLVALALASALALALALGLFFLILGGGHAPRMRKNKTNAKAKAKAKAKATRKPTSTRHDRKAASKNKLRCGSETLS